LTERELMTDAPIMSLDEIEDLAFQAPTAAGTSGANARPLARATAATEADGSAPQHERSALNGSGAAKGTYEGSSC
jgi:hypothetical protein